MNSSIDRPSYRRAQISARIEDAADARLLGAGNIARGVADHEGGGGVDVVLAQGAQEKPRCGFAAVTVLPVGGNLCRRMMRTIVERVDVRAALLQLRIHPIVQARDVVLGEVAARDAALIRDDDREIAVRIRPAHGIDRALRPHEVRGIVEIVHIDVERAVTVEKDRLILRHRRNIRPHRGTRSTPAPPSP